LRNSDSNVKMRRVSTSGAIHREHPCYGEGEGLMNQNEFGHRGMLSNPEDISIQVLTFYLQAHATMILAQNRWVSKGRGGL